MQFICYLCDAPSVHNMIPTHTTQVRDAGRYSTRGLSLTAIIVNKHRQQIILKYANLNNRVVQSGLLFIGNRSVAQGNF